MFSMVDTARQFRPDISRTVSQRWVLRTAVNQFVLQLVANNLHTSSIFRQIQYMGWNETTAHAAVGFKNNRAETWQLQVACAPQLAHASRGERSLLRSIDGFKKGWIQAGPVRGSSEAEDVDANRLVTACRRCVHAIHTRLSTVYSSADLMYLRDNLGGDRRAWHLFRHSPIQPVSASEAVKQFEFSSHAGT